MADLDLLELLSADHRLLLDDPHLQVAEISQHLSVERDLLYPAIRHGVGGGETIVVELRRQERRMEEHLAAYEASPSPAEQQRLEDAVRDHVDDQEALFVALRSLIPEADLIAAVDTVALSIGGSPTHAHPQLADGGARGELVEDLASAVDHLRDRAHASERGRG